MSRVEHDRDTCACGDFREQHVLGRGACRVCRWEYQPLGYPCMRFRLARKVARAALAEQGEAG